MGSGAPSGTKLIFDREGRMGFEWKVDGDGEGVDGEGEGDGDGEEMVFGMEG